MKKFEVEITEVLKKKVIIEAENPKQAEELAELNWDKGDYELINSEDFDSSNFKIIRTVKDIYKVKSSDIVKYIGEDVAHNGKNAVITGVHASKDYLELTFGDRSVINANRSEVELVSKNVTLETAFTETEKDTYAIYQLKDDESLRDYRFTGIKELDEMGKRIIPENYELKYVDTLKQPVRSIEGILNGLYYQFNELTPVDFKGHSLSVSDIIALKVDDEITCHFVDSVGFEKLGDFFEKYPDKFKTGERISTPRGSFSLTFLTEYQMSALGYGYHHSTDDNEYKIMGNGTRAFAVKSNTEKAKVEQKTCTKSFKVYGHNERRQRESFNKSIVGNWSEGKNTRIVEIQNSDITGTNEYSILKITRNTEKDVYEELCGQLDDGFFKNSRTGDIIDVDTKKEINPWEIYNNFLENEECSKTIMYSSIASEFVKSSDTFVDEELNVYLNSRGKEYALGYGSFGDGTTVWNFLDMENSDYKTVAYISPTGTIEVYDKDMPITALNAVKKSIAKQPISSIMPKKSVLEQLRANKPTQTKSKENRNNNEMER